MYRDTKYPNDVFLNYILFHLLLYTRNSSRSPPLPKAAALTITADSPGPAGAASFEPSAAPENSLSGGTEASTGGGDPDAAGTTPLAPSAAPAHAGGGGTGASSDAW